MKVKELLNDEAFLNEVEEIRFAEDFYDDNINMDVLKEFEDFEVSREVSQDIFDTATNNYSKNNKVLNACVLIALSKAVDRALRSN